MPTSRNSRNFIEVVLNPERQKMVDFDQELYFVVFFYYLLLNQFSTWIISTSTN